MKRLDGPDTGAFRLAILTTAVLALAACGQANGNAHDGGDGQAQNEQTHNGEETPAPEREETPGDGTEEAATGEDRQQAESENFERHWRVGDGGQVGVRFEDGSLDLLDARPNDEWDVKVDKRSGDKIEVDFSRAEETWGFDAELDDGSLEVRIRHELRDAEAGTYRLGGAGAVEVQHEGEGITLVQTRTTGGWSERVQQADDEVEVRLARHDELWTFEAEVDDGRLEVHTARTVNNPVRT